MRIAVVSLLLLLVCLASSDQADPGDVPALLRELAATVAQQKVDIMFLQRQNQDQAAKLKELEGQKIEQQAQQVAFSASLLPDGEATIGPFQSHTTLVYKHVVTNFGNAYSSDTGVFTAPVRGVFHFEWHINQHGDAAHPTGVYLAKNSENIFMAYEHNQSGFGSSSNGINLFLEAGETVSLRLLKGATLFDNYSHHTTFSGQLLFSI